MQSQPVVVWSEIPVSDMKRAVAFYNATFDWQMTIDESGPNPMAILGGNMETIGGHLYPGKPASAGSGPTVHISVSDKLEDAADRCRKAGGTVLGDPIAIPAGRFVYATDPDGNSIGLFEPKAG
ncbi:VOC family protein [Defluviimonas sp. WL0024]|uniref:VOC family protein n=2 Tax=Albidovulum TaxID=205889 RepID=A0ABT3J1Z2_9RHOB|nr:MULTISPECIES: VOC family protein [Defluviimonas]MCU9847488.1 VOC family protein [Defluviimonas sp. WL0024]MCW3781680.1 VOC family protein [Defluviimonas salinarum]